MHTRRIVALLLALLLLTALLPAQAEAPQAGCPGSPDGEHQWGDWQVIQQPSCTVPGKRAHSCKRCGKRETETIPAGHRYGSWEVETEGDCMHQKVMARTCTICGYKDVMYQEYGSHVWDEGTVTKEPTATEDGVLTYTCTVNPEHKKTEVIPAKGVTEVHPSLHLDLNSAEYSYIESAPDVSFHMFWDYGADTDETITNTGDIPLDVQQVYWYYDNPEGWDGIDYWDITMPENMTWPYVEWKAGPDEEHHWNGRYSAHAFYDHYVWDQRINVITKTPNDPLYEGYCTISVMYRGYATEEYKEQLGTDVLCESNVCTFTIRIPRKTALPPAADEGGDHCSLTLKALAATGSAGVLHSCSAHLETAKAAEAAAAGGDWAQAAALWRVQVDELYEQLWSAANEDGKAVVKQAQEAFYAQVEAAGAMLAAVDPQRAAQARAEQLRLRCTVLCCMLHTAGEMQPNSLTGDFERMEEGAYAEACRRVIVAMDDADSWVRERYTAAYGAALNATLDALAETEDSAAAFRNAQWLWQTFLDSCVAGIADSGVRALAEEWRGRVQEWSAAERPLMQLMHGENTAVVEEALVSLYREALLTAEGRGK